MNLIEEAKAFIEKLFKDKLSTLYTYHNLKHTTDVVAAVNEIITVEDLNSVDKKILLLAAWFHDVGYVNGCHQHEESSIAMMTDFLINKGQDLQTIKRVATLIRSTTLGYIPQTLLEKIINDADSHHISSNQYDVTCNALRMELQNTSQKTFSDLEWNNENIHFLVNRHQYYTKYALENWQTAKEKTIQILQENKVKMELSSTKEVKKKSKEDKPDRAVDTLFRITLNNHTTLSGIADSKANILLSVNAIIISIALSTLIPKLDSPSNAHLMIPTFIMLLSSVITIIFAILSTRPKVTKGVFTRQDIENKKVNLLFFGNFYKMPLDEYQWAMNEMMKDKDYLYNSMIKDLYFLGLVLERKYRLLRITYNFFMFGIIISVISFVIAFRMV